MDRFEDDNLFAALRALRPTPRPEFTAALDERVAAGFPRRARTSAAAMPFALLADHWRALSPRRRLMPVLAVALAALVATTALVAISQSGTKSNPSDEAVVGMVPGAGESGRSAEESVGASQSLAPNRHSGGEKGGSHHGGAGGGGTSGSESAGEAVYEVEIPSIVPMAGTAAKAGPLLEAGPSSAAAAGKSNAPAVTHRDVERSAYVILGTKPGEVASAAARVFEAVHAARGIVLHSQVRSGSTGATGAYFELLIPSRKLDDALAAFSQIAEVRQRHDASDDITAPTVGAGEELRDSNAAIEGLLKELGDVETEAERESVEARLREERRHHAAIRASLDHLHKRASMSQVTVRIVADRGAGATPPSKDDGSWGVGDALHDAGHILTIAAGVVLVGLAILGPIALVIFAFWLANRFRIRRLRERTLG